jgi:hypothetical protein
MTRPTLDTRRRLDQAQGPARSSLRPWVTWRGTSLESVARRVSIVVIGLVAFGCVAGQTQPDHLFPLVVLAFGLVAGVLFLLCTWMLVLVSSGRRRRKLAKILVALGAGSVCGALWILFVDTVVSAAIPDAMNEPPVLIAGAMTALVAATLLSMPNRLSKVVGLSAMAVGFHSLALPIAALISIFVGGAQWVRAASVRPALSAAILGTRLVVDLRTVGLSIGGLLFGLFLVFVGDRVLRRSRMPSSKARFDLSRPPA